MNCASAGNLTRQPGHHTANSRARTSAIRSRSLRAFPCLRLSGMVLWRCRLGAVGVGAVVDFDDGVVGVVDAQQDAVVTAACAVEAFEVVAQWLAEAVRVAGEGPGDELDDSVDDPGWKALQIAACGRCDLDAVLIGRVRGVVAHWGGMPCSARRSSRETVWPAAYSTSAAATASRMPARESQ